MSDPAAEPDRSTGPLAAKDWRVIREETRPGAVNMALDEIAAETAAEGGPRTVRVYRWTPSCLSLGYHQDRDTVDWDYCTREGVEVTRRQTGGGGIYHDSHADVSYSIIAPADELPGDLLESYHLLCEPVLEAFKRLGIDADYASEQRPALYPPACYLRKLHPAHDILARAAGSNEARRKISGNAQYRQKDAVIQHGSITYAVRPEQHLATFAEPGVGVTGFRERVVGIADLVDVSRAEAVRTLESALIEWAEASEGGWSEKELERGQKLATDKYRDDTWVRDGSFDRE